MYERRNKFDINKMICEQCKTEIPVENNFCGSCGTKKTEKVKKSFNEEMKDIFNETLKHHRRIWFTLGFFKGMGHEVRDKKYFNGLMNLWAKEKKETAKEYEEMLKFWKEWDGEDIDNFGKKDKTKNPVKKRS